MHQEFIYRFLSGELDQEQTKVLFDWINKDERNKRLFYETKILWVNSYSGTNYHVNQQEELGKLTERLGFDDNEEQIKLDIQRFVINRTSIYNNRYKIAAIALLICGLSIVFIHFLPKEEQLVYNEISTRRGEQSELILSDGTHIWLNSETTLKYPQNISKKNVNVYLRGEAYFKVSKNPDRKFIVNTGNIHIAVLGTSFNVKSYGDEGTIETTLEEGKIVITGAIDQKQIEEPIVLKPNQRITFVKNDKSYHLTEINPQRQADSTLSNERPILKSKDALVNVTDTKLYTSWKDGVFLFKNERFEDLAYKMERWYNIKIIIKDTSLKNTRYTGVFEKETIEQALNALDLSLPFEYSINQNLITIEAEQ